jgi:hypothetical protein
MPARRRALMDVRLLAAIEHSLVSLTASAEDGSRTRDRRERVRERLMAALPSPATIEKRKRDSVFKSE